MQSKCSSTLWLRDDFVSRLCVSGTACCSDRGDDVIRPKAFQRSSAAIWATSASTLDSMDLFKENLNLNAVPDDGYSVQTLDTVSDISLDKGKRQKHIETRGPNQRWEQYLVFEWTVEFKKGYEACGAQLLVASSRSSSASRIYYYNKGVPQALQR